MSFPLTLKTKSAAVHMNSTLRAAAHLAISKRIGLRLSVKYWAAISNNSTRHKSIQHTILDCQETSTCVGGCASRCNFGFSRFPPGQTFTGGIYRLVANTKPLKFQQDFNDRAANGIPY